MVIIAGPNGSGKSSLTRDGRLAEVGILFPTKYINADDIAREFHGAMPDDTQEEREWAAFREARARRRTYCASGEPFAFETVFSHPSTLMDMRHARAAGFAVVLLFVCTADPEINVARVAGRVRQGGHNVNTDKIRDRYRRAMALLPRAVETATTALVFDSTQEKETRLCYQRGRFSVESGVPPYLRDRLIIPLASRVEERDVIAGRFTVAVPNEAEGDYTGVIVWHGDHYAVQETPKGLVRHDGLLFDALPNTAETVTIRYKDNAGIVEK